MIRTAERCTIKGFGVPRPITWEARSENYITVLHDLVMRGHLNRKEEEYVELLSLLIQAYEEEHYSIPDASPVEVIKELMAANDLRQKDLVDIFGSESMVSLVLNGQRPLALAHIQALSRRFKVSPAAFIKA